MGHLLYLMFRCDGDAMESLDFGEVFDASKHTQERAFKYKGSPKSRLTYWNVSSNPTDHPLVGI